MSMKSIYEIKIFSSNDVNSANDTYLCAVIVYALVV